MAGFLNWRPKRGRRIISKLLVAKVGVDVFRTVNCRPIELWNCSLFGLGFYDGTLKLDVGLSIWLGLKANTNLMDSDAVVLPFTFCTFICCRRDSLVCNVLCRGVLVILVLVGMPKESICMYKMNLLDALVDTYNSTIVL
uniref:Uncharacterized protein n=1 Tax=Cucumis melo TaxID=3656 RepID=A0A9I9EL34_CUCME